MQMILNLIGKDERGQVKKYSAFGQVLDRLERVGFDLRWSRKELEQGLAELAVIDDKEKYDKETKSLVSTKDVRTMDTVFVSYMFYTSHKGKFLLSPEALVEHDEELIINKNKELLTHLYINKLVEKKRRRQADNSI